MTLQQYKNLIDLVVNAILNFWNMMRGTGLLFYVWVGILFIMPYFKRIYRALKGK